MGATQLECIVMSFTRAAGKFAIMTFVEPKATIPGPPGTQPGSKHGTVVLVTVAAGRFPIRTVGAPLIMAKGRPGCGTGVGTGAAGWIGAWQCGASCFTRSLIRAAKGICFSFSVQINRFSDTSRMSSSDRKFISFSESMVSFS